VIIFSKDVRDFTFEIYEDRIVEFYVQEARDCLGQWLIEFQINPDIAVIAVGRMTLRAPVSGVRSKSIMK